MIPIYIPSRARFDRVAQGTWSQLPPSIRKNVTYVVPVGEQCDYQDALPDAEIVSIFGEEGGIGKIRGWIGQQAAGANQPKFMMMDDDTTNIFKRISPDDWHLRIASMPERVSLFKKVEKMLDEYPVVGVSMREGNNRKKGPWEECQRIYSWVSFQTAVFNKCKHDRCGVKEDFDIQLQILTQGMPTVLITEYAQSMWASNAPGGCSTWRTLGVHNRETKRFCNLWPQYVKLRGVKHKGDFGERLEVTIQWKKAFKAGLEA